jgi:hypothetical protein
MSDEDLYLTLNPSYPRISGVHPKTDPRYPRNSGVHLTSDPLFESGMLIFIVFYSADTEETFN